MTLKATGTIWKKEPMYRYCTKKMVDKAVKQGREAVIKCASDKWWFFGTCTEKELSVKYNRRNKDLTFTGTNCSLCRFFDDDCYCCPQSRPYCMDEDSLYKRARSRFDLWTDNPTATNFKKFQAKARKLARVIGRLK